MIKYLQIITYNLHCKTLMLYQNGSNIVEHLVTFMNIDHIEGKGNGTVFW